MNRLTLLGASLALVVFVTSATAQTALPATKLDRGIFRSVVDLVPLTVSVTDAHEKYITGLGRDDFAVFEDGVQQDLSFFAANRAPLDLAILLDTSASMTDKMRLVQEAAIGFARTLQAGDRCSIVAFNRAVRVLAPFTGEIDKLEAAIRGTTPGGATSLYDAVYVTLKESGRATRENREVRRQAMVVLTDGEDTASLVNFDDVMDLAKRAGVNVYTISLVSERLARQIQAEGGHRYFSEADYAIRTLARESGARSFFPLRVEELTDVYGAIAEELSHEYLLGYASKNPRRDGVFRRVVVRVVTRLDARPRTRTGYFASGPTSAALSARP